MIESPITLKIADVTDGAKFHSYVMVFGTSWPSQLTNVYTSPPRIANHVQLLKFVYRCRKLNASIRAIK
jgi:hypothetical protein